jgi:hypothetical protein
MSEFKGWCKDCQEEEIYSETLTKGLCLNCYNKLQNEIYLMEIEYRHDYEEGYLE